MTATTYHDRGVGAMPAGIDAAASVPLGRTGWQVWTSALLRAAGFPVADIQAFQAPGLALAADSLLDAGRAGSAWRPETPEELHPLHREFAAAIERSSRLIHDIAGRSDFREAVCWQNPALTATMLDRLLARGPAARRNVSRRNKENGILRYLSRYCVKNDTIGFFGPVCWVWLQQGPFGVRASPGDRLVRHRRVFVERWALAAYADTLGSDLATRAWFPAIAQPGLCIDADGVQHTTRGTIAIRPAERAILQRCDGRTPVAKIARELAADAESGLRREADVVLAVGQLADRGILRWGIELPVAPGYEDVLVDRLAAIEDPGVREPALAGYRRLTDARDRVAAAAGDPATLTSALADLDVVFADLTGRGATRAAGQMYAGRTVCYEDTARDLDVRIGTALLDALAEPLDLLLTAARWMSTRIAAVYSDAIRALFEELVAEHDGGPVPAAELWFLAQGLFYGPGEKPIDEISREFTEKWASVLSLDAQQHHVRFTAAELASPVREMFPAAAPGWSWARYHSTDLHLLAADEAALERGEVSFVLGELHAAWNTVDTFCFAFAHPDRAGLVRHLIEEMPPGRLLPVLPLGWPRMTPRTAPAVRNPADFDLGFTDAPIATDDRLVPVTSLSVADEDGELIATNGFGQRWPILEVFGELLSIHAVDAFKLLGGLDHVPRVSIDNLVVLRESWSFTGSSFGFVGLADERDRYLAVRSWRRRFGLPERVFVKTPNEVKPFYVDLTSPVHVEVFVVALRAAVRAGGPEVAVGISEMLPDAADAWVSDAAGARYVSELRLQFCDPRRVRWSGTDTTARSRRRP